MSKIDGTQKGEPKECNIDYRHVHIHADMNFILSLKDLFSGIYSLSVYTENELQYFL